MFLPHAMQLDSAPAASVLLYRPAGHLMHFVASATPVLDEYLPASHLVQSLGSLDPARNPNLPLSHAMHAFEEFAASTKPYLPETQLIHFVTSSIAVAEEYVPDGQLKQTSFVCFGRLKYLPAMHGMHWLSLDAPSTKPYLPEEHRWHGMEDEPEYVPVSHLIQFLAPGSVKVSVTEPFAQ